MTANGTRHANAAAAVQYLDASGDFRACLIGRDYVTVTEAEYRRLQAAGYQPTTYHWNDAAGCLMSVPGDD